MTRHANAIAAVLEAAVDHAKAEAKARKPRTPIPYEIPRDLWEPPAGTLKADAPLDDYMTVNELTAALVENGGTVWRWLVPTQQPQRLGHDRRHRLQGPGQPQRHHGAAPRADRP
jgi:type IV secretory pathway TrbF-like protein